jgi:hypothetical protein
MSVVETARLKLLPLNARFNDDLFKLFNEPEVADWLFLTGPPTREQVDARTTDLGRARIRDVRRAGESERAICGPGWPNDHTRNGPY